MHVVDCEIVRFISVEPQPGWVEAVLTDANGERWVFHDKPPIFTTEPIGPADHYPCRGEIRCSVLGEPNGQDNTVPIATIGCDSIDGSNRFAVPADRVREL